VPTVGKSDRRGASGGPAADDDRLEGRGAHGRRLPDGAPLGGGWQPL
jgi:hypothetical protein